MVRIGDGNLGSSSKPSPCEFLAFVRDTATIVIPKGLRWSGYRRVHVIKLVVGR